MVAAEVTGLEYDSEKLLRLGVYHDDAEFLTGDIPGNIKRAMSEEERTSPSWKEEEASRALAKYCLNINGELDVDQYIEDQREAREKATFEAQIVDVADKWDALGEVMHELRCGNWEFIPVFKRYEKLFKGFNKYDFWRRIKADRRTELGETPLISPVILLPRLSSESFPTKDRLEEVTMQAEHMPIYYRWWLEITFKGFDLHTEKYLYPGWYLEFWKKWGVPKDVKSTLSGVDLI